MTDHRAIQRALFRMQLDPRFAERLRAREPEAVESAGLGAEELAILAGADPAGVTADRDGVRRAQFLRNATSEFALTLAVTADPRIAEEFTESPEFHAAVASDASLPLAFARHLGPRIAAASDTVRALAALETALAIARRARRVAPRLAPGEVTLAPWAELVRVPAGSLDAAAGVRAALDQGEPKPRRAEVSASEVEILLVRRAPEPPPFRLAEVEVESLSEDLAVLLRLASQPFAASARAAHASDAGVSAGELEAIVADLVSERILIAG